MVSSQVRHWINRARPGLLFLLFIASCSFLLSTYSGVIDSGDAVRIFDAATSWVHFGDFNSDEALWQTPPQVWDVEAKYPNTPYEEEERLSVIVASVFYRIGDYFGFGFVHTTWLMNIITTALSTVILYCFLRELGIESKLALFAWLLLLTSTSLWFYSKTLFRESLVMLFLLTTLFMLYRFQASNYRHFWTLVCGVIAFLAAYYTKNSSLIALPALLVILVPSWSLSPMARRFIASGLLFGIVIVLIFAIVPSASDVLVSLGVPFNLTYFQTALSAYLLTPAGSIWGTSPILLLAPFGALLWWKQGYQRLVTCIVLLTLSYVGGHAVLTQQHWAGGLSLPPRFLIPLIPMLLVFIVPIYERLLERRSWVWWLAIVPLMVYSVGVQVVNAISLQGAYVDLLPPESGGLNEWYPAYINPQYFRWVLLPTTWSTLGLDIAWTRIDLAWMVIAFLGLFVFACVVLFRAKNYPLVNVFIAAMMLALLGFGLRQLALTDREYWADKASLFQMLDVLEAQSRDGEPLYLADPSYDRFIFNYNHLSQVRPYVLNFQPGEAVSDSHPPRIRSNFVPELLTRDTVQLLSWLNARHERAWLLAHNSRYLPWSIRPVEHFLVQNYYLMQEMTTADPDVRLLEFLTTKAPSPYGFVLPEHQTDLVYGDLIHLDGFTLPEGQVYQAGEGVPITLWWRSTELLMTDYVVAWFITKSDYAYPPIQGADSMPEGNFNPTSTWLPNQTVLDNRAIQLPQDTPTGDYRIWVVLYSQTAEGATRLTASGNEILDETIGVLPITITIR